MSNALFCCALKSRLPSNSSYLSLSLSFASLYGTLHERTRTTTTKHLLALLISVYASLLSYANIQSDIFFYFVLSCLVLGVCCWGVLSVVVCCWVLLSAVGCCWVLLGVAECCWVLLSVVGCCWVLLGVAECCWVLLSAVVCCWGLLDDVGCCC